MTETETDSRPTDDAGAASPTDDDDADVRRGGGAAHADPGAAAARHLSGRTGARRLRRWRCWSGRTWPTCAGPLLVAAAIDTGIPAAVGGRPAPLAWAVAGYAGRGRRRGRAARGASCC